MTAFDLTSLVITLAPQRPVETSPHLGRASYALLLRLLDAADPDLAAALHNGDGPKPLTCSTLVGGERVAPDRRRYDPEHPAWLRFTGLTPAVSGRLQALAADLPELVELDEISFAVLGATLDPADHPWAGATTYEALAAPYLLAKQSPAFRLDFHFASPTAFKSQGAYRPVPLGGWLFGSLLDRWNAFSPVTLAPEVRRFAEECAVLSRYRLRTGSVRFKGIVLRGAVGQATYALLVKDRFWASMLNLLAGFAFYSGAGYQTAAGLGQVRRMAEKMVGSR